MKSIELAVATITLIGALLPFLGRKGLVEVGATSTPSGVNYLKVFALLVVVFGVLTAVYYRGVLGARLGDVIFSVWLFIAMVAGMLAQTIASNYRARRRLFAIPRDRILYPLLFSVIVFYPIWALASSSTPSFFVIHAAFLNGYFWESIVSAAKPPASS